MYPIIDYLEPKPSIPSYAPINPSEGAHLGYLDPWRPDDPGVNRIKHYRSPTFTVDGLGFRLVEGGRVGL